ncbi:hypothetical protein D915_000391 [Fasciola hepatica]|uniref:CUB domain-containing protein n=1 Tax=Fasciola hepatica TaxID=6192 RepID=A0A4E0RYB6_FASHE|nr:hypothetical protein D915_000391 [Fasciola hepatica]
MRTVVPPSNAVSSCGSVEKSLSGSIFNRGYPQPFPVGTNCMWMITGPENKLIRFTLQTYRQHEKEHASNIFEVWTLKEKKVLRLSPIRASGLQTSRDIFGPLIFKFVHNRKLAPGQFLINYKTMRNEINQLPEGETRSQPRIIPNGYVRNEINQLPEGETRPQPRINPNGYADERPTLDPSCSSVYKTPSGNIHNVEYPQPFTNGTNCMWIVIPPENKYIRFTLKGHCLHEKEHIANIFEVWTLSGKEVLRLNPIRASDLEVGKYTPGPLIFKFVHNRKLEPGQFLVDYRATDTSGSPTANQANDQCGEYLTSESGKISYPLPRSQFTEEVRCLWVIENQPNHQIHFNMTKFDVPNTSRDYIEIWVFDSKNVIKKYVMDRESRPKKVFRFRRSVMIWFHPFGNRPNSKFSFEYTRVIKQDATKVRKRT